MPNRYANLVGSNKIKDEWQKINQGFDAVEAEMDTRETVAGAQAKANAAQTAAISAAATDATNKVNTHAADAVKHVTAAERTTWNAKASTNSPAFTGTPTAPTAGLGTNTNQIATTAFVQENLNDEIGALPTVYAPLSHVGSGGSVHAPASTSTAGFMSAADKTKLNGIAASAEVNQNAISKINNIEADAKSTTINIAAGTGIAVTTNPTTKTLNITATGEATPGAHASSHVSGGSDVIPNAVAGGNSGLMSGEDKALLDETSSRLSDTNTQTTQLSHGQNLISTSEAGPVGVEVRGNTLVNLNAAYGNFEADNNGDGVANGWSKSSSGEAQYALNTSNYSYGLCSQSMTAPSTIGATDCFVHRAIPVSAGKYYVALIDFLNDSGILGMLRISGPAIGTPIADTNTRTTGTVAVKFNSASLTSVYLIAFNRSGPEGGGTLSVDGARMYEVTAEEYAKINVDPDWIGEKLAERFPYVDGVKHVTNPVITKVGKNLLPPFTQWTLHTRSVINGPYELAHNYTTTSGETDHVDLPILPNTTYTFGITADANLSKVEYSIFDVSGTTLVNNTSTGITKIFTTPSDSVRLRARIANRAVGMSIISEPILVLGDSLPATFEPRDDDYLYADCTLAGYSGVHDILKVRGTEATVLRKWIRDVVVDGGLSWALSSNLTGFKTITAGPTFPLAKARSGVAIKHDGKMLKEYAANGSVWESDMHTITTDGTLFMSVLNEDSGWGESYSPINTEARAYFRGWKMNNGTFGTPYNGSGTKTWTRWNATNNTGAVTTVPTTTAEGYTPYRLSYQLAAPVTEVVSMEGSLANHAGANLYEMSEGVIIRERATMTPSASGENYSFNTYNAVSYPVNTPLSYRAKKIIDIYEGNNSIMSKCVMLTEGAWGNERYRLPTIHYNPTTDYYVTYLALDKYALTAPVVSANLSYKTQMGGVVSQLVQGLADNNTKDTVQDWQLLQDEAHIKNINIDLTAATASPTPNTLIKRDSNGRAQTAAPSAAGDAANKGYVDSAVAGVTIPDASLTVKGKVQLNSATNSESEALAATPKAVKAAYDRAEAAFQSASDGKTAVAAAITGMGQSAAGSETFAQLATKVGQISNDANAAVGEVLSGRTFYQGGVKRTGAMTDRGAPTFTPGAASQSIPAGRYTGGTIAGDADLIAANIRQGINIFGVNGSLIEGRQWASGNTPSVYSNTYYKITVTGLAFAPKIIVASGVGGPKSIILPQNAIDGNTADNSHYTLSFAGGTWETITSLGTGSNQFRLLENGFEMIVYRFNMSGYPAPEAGNYNWIAFGVPN